MEPSFLKQRGYSVSWTHGKLPDFYQDLALRPVRQEIRRLPKKDQLLGCAPLQRDEGVSAEEVGSGAGDGRPGRMRSG